MLTVMNANWLTPPAEPLIETEVPTATVFAVIVKVAAVAPSGTVRLAGTVATVVSLLNSVTTVPPAGAARFSVAVPVAVAPLLMSVGETARDASTGFPPGLTLSTAVCVT